MTAVTRMNSDMSRCDTYRLSLVALIAAGMSMFMPATQAVGAEPDSVIIDKLLTAKAGDKKSSDTAGKGHSLKVTRNENRLQFSVKQAEQLSFLGGPLRTSDLQHDFNISFEQPQMLAAEDETRVTVTYKLKNIEGKLSATVAPLDVWQQGDFGGYRHAAPVIWPVATHGWMMAHVTIYGLYSFPEWRIDEGLVARGFDASWTPLEAPESGGVTFGEDDDLLLWRAGGLTSLQTGRPIAVAPVPEFGFGKHGPPNTLDDPLERRQVSANYSQLVKFSEVSADGSLKLVTNDGVAHRVLPDGTTRQWDLLPELLPIRECPKLRTLAASAVCS